MDFRDRHPKLATWNEQIFDEIETNFPYDSLMDGRLATIPAFDYSTTFMLWIGRLSHDESSWYGYGLESPPDDPTKRQFENGEIDWTDFIFSRDWLIEFKVPFPVGEIKAKYISPNAISQETKNDLIKLDALGSPYQILHDNLLRSWQWEFKHRPKETEARTEYFEFLKKYQGLFKLEKKAA